MRNIEKFIPKEEESKPRFRLMVTRHAERLPSGELSLLGIELAKSKGKSFQNKAEVLKGYASDEKSKRTVKTSELISDYSKIVSPETKKHYMTREVKDIQYGMIESELMKELKKAVQMINVATLEKINIKPEYNEKGKLINPPKNLPKDRQKEIALIRQNLQYVGIEYILAKSEFVDRFAWGIGHQLVHELKIAKRYKRARETYEKPPKKDIILNTISHGVFIESLLMKVGIYKDREIKDFREFESSEFGGFFQPGESIYLDIDDPDNIPEKIPVVFEGENRPKIGEVFIDRNKLFQLDKDYKEWKSKK